MSCSHSLLPSCPHPICLLLKRSTRATLVERGRRLGQPRGDVSRTSGAIGRSRSRWWRCDQWLGCRVAGFSQGLKDSLAIAGALEVQSSSRAIEVAK